MTQTLKSLYFAESIAQLAQMVLTEAFSESLVVLQDQKGNYQKQDLLPVLKLLYSPAFFSVPQANE